MKEQFLRSDTMRDISLALMLIALFFAVLLCVMIPGAQDTEYLLMLSGCLIVIAAGFFGHGSLALVLAAAQVCAFTAYTLYSLFSYGTPLKTVDYLWLPIPLILAGTVYLFHYSSSRLETENSLLRMQVEDLVLIEPLTGMYNLRAMCRELPILAHYCVRNQLLLSLMIIDLRYENELRTILTTNKFNEVRQKLAEIIHDTVRTEDRVFAIDERGTLAVLLTTGDDGIPIVKRRLRAAVEAPDAFDGIMDESIQVSIRIACKEYDFNFSLNPLEFKKMVESELVYDV